jgi:hypothetical protein
MFMRSAIPAVILQHRSAKVTLDTKPFDPREQAVNESHESTDAPYPGLPVLGHSEPIELAPPPHLLALRGELPANTCAACGEPMALHYATDGCLWVGCYGVSSRKALEAMVPRSLRDATVWGDAHPMVSAAIRDLLLVACGVETATWFSGLQADERINLSRRLAEVAAIAVRAEDAKRAGGKP